MKILAIHSDYIKVEKKKKAIKDAEESAEVDLSMDDCLVVFCSAEKEDESNPNSVAKQLVANIDDIAKQVKAERIMLYPYVHLSSKPSSPKVAQEILKQAEKDLKSFEVKHAPFGWYKSFEIKCKGHPLSELSREFGPAVEKQKSGESLALKSPFKSGKMYDHLVSFLDKHNANYRLIDHPAEGRTEIVSPMRGNKVSQAAKCIVIMVKSKDDTKKYVLCVVPGDAKLDLDAIKALFSGVYVSFATPDIAEKLAGSVSGTILPFSFNSELELVVDPVLLENKELFFNAARLDRSMALKTNDYVRLANPRLEKIADYPQGQQVSGQKSDLKREAKDESFVFNSKDLSKQEKESLSAAAIVASVVRQIYPDSQLASIGLYQDQAYVDVKGIIVRKNELAYLEKESRKVLRETPKFLAGKKFDLSGLQQEIFNDLGKDAKIFQMGRTAIIAGYKEPFVDGIVALKLVNSGSAYWKNNEKNDQLTRIYCVGFSDKKKMEEYLKQREEAENKSHLKIGKEQGLFVISDLVGAGLPLLAPNGMILRQEIINFLWQLHKHKGYEQVCTPHIARDALYKTSGHWDKFGDELFKVQGKSESFVMKPMNCPHHMQIFAAFPHSYKDMPVRFFEPAVVYRDEKSGQLHGLSRVRSITQDDGHLFCRVSQIGQEVRTMVEIIHKFYNTIGMDKDYWVSLSVRGDDKSKYLGTDENWNIAEMALEKAAKELKLPYKRIPGEAAFYGPKLDFMFKDALGREWQLATVQCDFNLPQRFDLFYINEKDEKEQPVVMHRAISGSLERFMSIIIEHFAGKFPLWLNPKQVKIVTVTNRAQAFADELFQKLREFDIRVSIDYRGETVAKKIHSAHTEHVNYTLVLGDKEVDTKTLAVRAREGKVEYGVSLDKFIKDLLNERDNRLIK
ncbi:threonine--tRNA ligase [Candidatus Woesearchaeota archaeon CG10_big_fil_rev_8_21_14_0_10_37_12]|nr:MAG: threonine--tRNA ligase [Candidatus Woesearchaeota archaeon CG10_big_fil_rev_8_21_14_0_10_37_12]